MATKANNMDKKKPVKAVLEMLEEDDEFEEFENEGMYSLNLVQSLHPVSMNIGAAEKSL